MELSVLIITILALSANLASGKNTESNELEAAIQDIFKEFFGLSPPEAHHLTPPPRHMLNLFRKYTSEHAGKDKDFDNPNTIRNIFPTTGPASLSDLVLFNVSSVRESESLQLAQIHLNRRRLHPRLHTHPNRHSRLLPPPHRLRLYQVTGTRLTTLGSVPLPQVARRGWHSIDITDQLNELLLHPGLTRSLLGVRFEASNRRSLTPKHFLRDNPGSPAAFLMLYSEDDPDAWEEGEDEEEDNETSKRANRPHTHDLAMKIQKVSGGGSRGKQWSAEISNDLFPGSATSSNIILNKVNASAMTAKHGVHHLNRVDGDSKIVVTKHMARQLPPSERQRRSLEAGLSPIDEMEDANDAARLADADGDGDAKARQSRMIIRGRAKPEPTRRPTVEPMAEQCSVQALTVDFADIGWDKWIYAPKTFEARFCAGSCMFPNALQLDSENHTNELVSSFKNKI
ncbi:growth/differentiation factor 10 [Nilaparvata lugens]|uniref:growth/differentiation factor 10 n=1 Tax=Nilaparvata lugens TaxID=108931 RepID=UPI00193EAA68|nr:growth/differentiation factor 10 [Nilaparvata lugens]